MHGSPSTRNSGGDAELRVATNAFKHLKPTTCNSNTRTERLLRKELGEVKDTGGRSTGCFNIKLKEINKFTNKVMISMIYVMLTCQNIVEQNNI